MHLDTLLDVMPIFMLIAIGVVLRLSGLITGDARLVLTRLAYHVTIPAAIFSSIARSRLTTSMLLLPVIGLGLPTLLAGIAYASTRRLADRPELRGVMLCAMVVLGVFGYPFFQLFFGEQGLARIAMYDVGNSLFAGTVALWLAQSFGTRRSKASNGGVWRRVLTSPVLLAAVAGVAASLLDVPLGGPLGDLLTRLTAANTPLAMIAVGVFLQPRAGYNALIAQFVLIRVVLGGVLGFVCARSLGMHGLDVLTACVAPTLPAGTTALIYAGNEGLDTEFAASMISVTVIIGAVTVNLLPHLLSSAAL